jgi:probable addiction module antidote protein
MNKKIELLPWDAAELLDTPEVQEEYLIAAFETEDPKFIAKALGTVARARNISQLARDAGMTRAALYRAFNGQTNPEFATILRILSAMGIGLAPVIRNRTDGVTTPPPAE